MKNETDHSAIDILLASYFAGEASDAERAQVDAWLELSEGNRNYFSESKKAWDASGKLLAGKTFDTDAAWRTLNRKMHKGADRSAQRKRNYVSMIAATVLVLVGTAITFWLMKYPPQEKDKFILSSEVENDTLPDGTIICLNRNTMITYPASFTGDQREITMDGEAFFDVSHDAEHPFVIHTGLMDVKVLGTSFNVRAGTRGDSVRVSVHTGKVQCMTGNDTVTILPGEYAVFYKGGSAIVKGKEDDPNHAAYRNRIFQFNDTPLGLAVVQLNDAYDCNIVLKNEALKNCRFTITKVFNNEPVENIIEAIQVIYPDITSTRTDGDTITLDGPGCQ